LGELLVGVGIFWLCANLVIIASLAKIGPWAEPKNKRRSAVVFMLQCKEEGYSPAFFTYDLIANCNRPNWCPQTGFLKGAYSVEIITRRDNDRHNVTYETPPVSTLEELQTHLAANATKMDISLDGEEESVLPVVTLVKNPIDAMCYGAKPTRLKLAFQTLDGLIPIKIVHVLCSVFYKEEMDEG
jgi:hypothetical protein